MTTTAAETSDDRAFLADLIEQMDAAEKRGQRLGDKFVTRAVRHNYPREFVSEKVLAAIDGMSDELTDELNRDTGLYAEFRKEFERRRAREILTTLDATQADDAPWNDGLLTEMTDAPVVWRCEGLIAKQARLLIQAQFKAGKTTWLLNFARCLVLGGYFLGRFETTPVTGNVGYLNYEVSEAQFLAWAKAVSIPLDRVYVNNLRGVPNPFASAEGLDYLADRLKQHDVESLIVDPYARAFPGDDLDRTGPAVAFTNSLDRLAELANLSEIAIANHAGHDAERGRNSTVLNDWADSIITLTRDKNDQRFMKAIGRDVELAEDRLDYDRETHILTLSGAGGRKASARNDKLAGLAPYAAQAITRAPEGTPISGSQIEDHFRGLGLTFTKGDGNKAAEAAHGLGVRLASDDGPRRAKRWVIGADDMVGDALDYADRAGGGN